VVPLCILCSVFEIIPRRAPSQLHVRSIATAAVGRHEVGSNLATTEEDIQRGKLLPHRLLNQPNTGNRPDFMTTTPVYEMEAPSVHGPDLLSSKLEVLPIKEQVSTVSTISSLESSPHVTTDIMPTRVASSAALVLPKADHHSPVSDELSAAVTVSSAHAEATIEPTPTTIPSEASPISDDSKVPILTMTKHNEARHSQIQLSNLDSTQSNSPPSATVDLPDTSRVHEQRNIAYAALPSE